MRRLTTMVGLLRLGPFHAKPSHTVSLPGSRQRGNDPKEPGLDTTYNQRRHQLCKPLFLSFILPTPLSFSSGKQTKQKQNNKKTPNLTHLTT
ncbi:hypothetical protein CI102_12729 [Trichoderma harzianum]|nr:hypothetical protein CI102_12729 [Trichoderma harzianum]